MTNMPVYPNQLQLVNLDHSAIEMQIKKFQLVFIQIRNKRVEWGMKLPMFVPVFYKYISEHNDTIPTQEQYWTYFKSQNQTWFSQNQIDGDTLVAIKARLFRTYPSLVRDIHFAKLLSSKLKKSEVVYNTDLDIKEGVDLLVLNQDKKYAINLYTDTKRAHEARSKKENRHQIYTDVTYLEIPVNFKGSVQLGQFFLYGEREITTIIQALKSTLKN